MRVGIEYLALFLREPQKTRLWPRKGYGLGFSGYARNSEPVPRKRRDWRLSLAHTHPTPPADPIAAHRATSVFDPLVTVDL